MDIMEHVTHLQNDGDAAQKGPFKSSHIRVYPMFGSPYEVDVPVTPGGHGGADPFLLEQLFSPHPPADPFHRAASHVDGAASVLVGIAGNESMKTGRMVNIDELFALPE
jgi:hypothetical protein